MEALHKTEGNQNKTNVPYQKDDTHTKKYGVIIQWNTIYQWIGMKGATSINIGEYNQQNIKKEKSMQNDAYSIYM